MNHDDHFGFAPFEPITRYGKKWETLVSLDILNSNSSEIVEHIYERMRIFEGVVDNYIWSLSDVAAKTLRNKVVDKYGPPGSRQNGLIAAALIIQTEAGILCELVEYMDKIASDNKYNLGKDLNLMDYFIYERSTKQDFIYLFPPNILTQLLRINRKP